MPVKNPDKTYFKNNIKYEEFYENGMINMFTTVDKTKERKIIKEFDANSTLMCETKIHYNDKGIPVKVEQWLYDEEKTNYSIKTIPVIPGYNDVKDMSEDDKKKHSDLINSYLITINNLKR